MAGPVPLTSIEVTCRDGSRCAHPANGAVRSPDRSDRFEGALGSIVSLARQCPIAYLEQPEFHAAVELARQALLERES